MNEIIKKLQIPRYETKMMILPRRNVSAKAKQVPNGIQLSFDIEMEATKQDREK